MSLPDQTLFLKLTSPSAYVLSLHTRRHFSVHFSTRLLPAFSTIRRCRARRRSSRRCRCPGRARTALHRNRRSRTRRRIRPPVRTPAHGHSRIPRARCCLPARPPAAGRVQLTSARARSPPCPPSWPLLRTSALLAACSLAAGSSACWRIASMPLRAFAVFVSAFSFVPSHDQAGEPDCYARC